ncbi:uncharacterized protein G2W53_039784 [Senna tora]|uniref:Uncharacterized protein n=1 Tax=Senna tora TaxID=362788 RepID=A0A834SNB3_9FABA|nr:uncharacterized protein G2W53_039784 [Senna tora]
MAPTASNINSMSIEGILEV